MNQTQQAYLAPDSDLEAELEPEHKSWILLATWTVMLTAINVGLSIMTTLIRADFESIDLLLAFVFGNVIVIPATVLVLSQLWKKFRNGRSRVKAFLYPGYFVLFAQFGPVFDLISENVGKAG
jgi:hypothetical protein